MENNLKVFMTLKEAEQVQEIASILETGKILHSIHDNNKDFDPTMSNNEAGKGIDILLLPQDFAKADQLISEKIELKDEMIDPEHFLFEFSESELRDVIKHSDEWHPLDVKLAKKILEDKGIPVTQEQISSFHKERYDEKSKPEKSAADWLIAGYLFALAGGLLGFFIGNHLMTFKKTLPDGTQVYNYDINDRKHGKWILIISILSMVVSISYFIFKKMN